MSESTSTAIDEILIVDDTTANLELLTDILTRAGYKIRPASSGELALRSVKAKIPALILLDIKMPGMDGLEVCRQLKAAEKTRTIPVIFISVLEDERSKIKGFQAGAVDYLTKPFYPEEILVRVKTHLSINRLQLKLERQNEQLLKEIAEREQAEEALQETNARHSAMVANIGDVIGIMGADGIMKYKSPNIERWFGWKPEDLVGTDGWETVHPEDIGRIQKEFYDLLEKNDASTTKIEYRYKCKDGTYTWVELTAVNCINDTTINGILLNYHDISERKQSENEMRVTENLLKEAQRVAHIGHWELDPSIGTPVWSDEIYRIFGLNPNESEPSFTKHETYIHPDDWLVLERAVEKGSMDGSPFDLIFRIMRPSGETSWMHAIGTTLMSNTGEVIKLFGTAQDITEDKKKTEELVKSKAELQNLATYLQNVIEKERTLLAREIHDELGQVLTALKMDITWLGDKIKDRKLVEKSLQIMEDIDQAIITVQSISTQLRPGILDHLGLFSAIEWQVEEFRKRTGINCELIIENEDVKIDPDSSTAAFRILQEALTNIIRHAEAKKVIVRSDMVNKRLDLEVTDNGIGMDIKNKSMSSAYGLTGIRERVRALNGKVSIDSTPGEGTTIRASIPVKQRELKS